MNRTVFIYIRAFFVMLICAAMLFCLCGCTVNDNNPNNVNNDIVEVPKPTPHPTPTFVPTVEPSPTPEQTAAATPEVTGAIMPGETDNPLSEEKLVALTFDDGPYGEVTNRILDVVEQYAEYGVHVTFFALGSQAEKFPNTVKRAADLGCEVANHTYSHKNLTKISEDERTSQVEDTADIIESITGTRSKLVRPPYGAKNDDVRATVKYPLILWSIDTLDWKTRDTDSTVAEALKAVDGDIVLMHDVREDTAAAAEQIIPALVEQGYKLVTVSEMFEAKGIALENGKAYRKAR